MLPLQGGGLPEEPELIYAEEHHNDAADPGKPGLVVAEEPAQGGEAEAQQEEGKADPQDEENSIYQHLLPGIADDPVLPHRARPAGQVADIQGHQGEHAGREKAQQALDEHRQGGDAHFQIKAHGFPPLRRRPGPAPPPDPPE